MSRLLPEATLILTARDARMLYSAAHLKDLRERNRVGDNELYALLTDISRLVYSEPLAVDGIGTRQSAASEDAEWWTVERLAKAVRLAERTVRLDIERGVVAGVKPAREWLVAAADAKAYVAWRRRR